MSCISNKKNWNPILTPTVLLSPCANQIDARQLKQASKLWKPWRWKGYTYINCWFWKRHDSVALIETHEVRLVTDCLQYGWTQKWIDEMMLSYDWGAFALFKGPHCGDLVHTSWPHCGASATLTKNGKCQQMPRQGGVGGGGWWWVGLELTGP